MKEKRTGLVDTSTVGICNLEREGEREGGRGRGRKGEREEGREGGRERKRPLYVYIMYMYYNSNMCHVLNHLVFLLS